MTLRMRGLRVPLALAILVTVATGADARGRRRRSYDTVELSTMRQNPTAFIGKRIAFDCFFAKLGRIYQPYQTPFVAEQFLNFHVWEPGTMLWDNKERKKAFLFCYVPRDLEKHVDYIMRRRMYEAIRIFGRVTVVYAEHPWFEVEDVEPSVMPGIPETALKHILVGIKSLTNEDFEMAQESFRRALEAGLPRSAQDFAQRELGKACYELGNFSEAEKALATAASVSPSDPWILLKRGQSLARAADDSKNVKLRKKMLKEALGYLERARELEPANPDCHAEIGWVRAKGGDRIAGIRDVKRAIALKSTAPSFRILGRIYIDMNQLAKAENAYHNAIVRDYQNPLYHREVADLIYMRQRRYADAEGEYGNLIQLTSTDPDGYFLRAKARLALGKVDDALKDYGEALRHDSEDLDALLGRAAVNVGRKEYEKARADLGQAERLAPNSVKVLVAKAEVLQAQGFYDDAVEAYGKILKMKIKDSKAQVYYGLGECLSRKPKAELSKAAGAIQKAVKLDPGNIDYLKTLAVVRMKLGKFSQAVKDLRGIKRLRSADETSRVRLGTALAESGKFREAMTEYEEVIRDIPDSLYARNNLAYLLLEYGRAGDVARAGDLAAYANKKQPANPDFQDTFAWAMYKKDDLERARQLLEVAVVTSTQADPFYHLAVVLNEQGNPEAARQPVEEALRRLYEIPHRGAVTKKLLDKAINLAKKVGASTKPGPRE